MSYHICTHCGEREDIFGAGGVEAASKRLGIPFLGGIPLVQAIREQADKGRPIVAADPKSSVSKIYQEMAKKLAAQVSIASFAQPALKIIED